LNLTELQRELSSGEVRPAYLVLGEEALLRDDALFAIESTVLESSPADFNLDRLDGSKTAPAALRDAVNALPVLGQHRLVIVRDPDVSRGAGKDLVEALPDIIALVKDQRETVLVLCADKADKRSRWVKAFAEPAAIVACDSPKQGRSLVAFVKQEAKRQGVALGDGAADLLAELVGPQLLVLRQEIAKCALHAGDDAEVSRACVQTSVSQVSENPVWDLTDAIGEGKRADAVVLLTRMKSSGLPAPVVLGSLASHFRKLARLRGGGSVPGPPFAIRKLEQQARRFTSARLLQCLDAIHDTDLALKGVGQLPADMALERLVLGLAS
jgi:DNA polymerase-3 subunit delta